MNSLRRVICLLLCAVMTLFALAPCSGGEEEQTDDTAKTSEKLTGLRLSETDITMTIGESDRVLRAYSNETGKEVSTVVWESADEEVVTVDPSGKLTAVGEGVTTVRAENIKDHTDAICNVKVTAKAEGITLDAAEIQIMVAGEHQIVAQMNPPTLEGNFKYQSKDPGIARVDENGLVTGLTSGTTQIIITAANSRYSATCTVRVYDYVTGATMNDSRILMTVGESDRLIGYKTEPANSMPTDIKWTSSDESVVSVNEEGRATAHKAGSATITVTLGNGTADGVKASVQVEVSAEAVSVKLSQTSLNLEVDQSHRLTATVTPSNAELKWSSSDPTVATVSSSGEVHALKLGKTVITAKIADGSAEARCEVTVGSDLGVTFEESEITLAMGSTQKLVPIFTPEGYSEKLTWKSSNNLVVNVDDNGLVTAKGVGTATVTVTGNSSGIKAQITIHVEKSVLNVKITEIQLTSDTVTVGVGEYAKVNLKLIPENANEAYSYKIIRGNASAILITTDGIFAMEEGSVTVVAVSAGGVKSDEFMVIVQPMTNSTRQRLAKEYNDLVSAENKDYNAKLSEINKKYDANIKYYQDRLKEMGIASNDDYLAQKQALEDQLDEQRAILETAIEEGDTETAAAAQRQIQELEKKLGNLDAASFYLEKLNEEEKNKKTEKDALDAEHEKRLKEIDEEYAFLLPYL